MLPKRYLTNKKIFPDKFADKEVLEESEVSFCKKEGIYELEILEGCFIGISVKK